MTKAQQSLVKVSINSPQSMANFATTLKEFIVKRNLYSVIKSKNYVNVEGWEFAGASLGIFPVVKWCERVKDEVPEGMASDELKYKARVELVMISSGKVVGAGEAICSNKEASKRGFDEYAIASMAQTRAIGKAFRNQFAWLMKMAGYEPTPAEEAQYVAEPPQPEISLDPLEQVIERVNAKLDTLSSVDRARTLKTVGKMNTKSLTEVNWRRLDMDLGTDKKDETDDNEKVTTEA